MQTGVFALASTLQPGVKGMKDQQSMLKDIEMEIRLTRRYIGKDSFDDRVMAAMREVPRQEFVPQESLRYAYENGPLPIGSGQTISQPYIVALMSDLLNTGPNDKILEIGTGSGYQAAILSRLVKQVYSVEIITGLASKARMRLEKLGYNNISVRSGDGYNGWQEYAPYDGIIVTAAAPFVPQSLMEQLREAAHLVIPIGQPYSYQELMVMKKMPEDGIETHKIIGVSFVPLTGICTTDPTHKTSYPPA